MDKQVFFDYIRRDPFRKGLNDTQVLNIEIILDACFRHGVVDEEEVAYILATTYHETGSTMKPLREYGQGKGRPYGRAHKKTGQRYYGRGYVQLTWYGNYLKLGKLLGINLVNDPDLALVPRHAADILVLGMRDGEFAPAAGPLSKYLGQAEDWLGARKTVNGKDRRVLIGGYGRAFDAALEAAGYIKSPYIRGNTRKTYDKPPKAFKPKSLLGRILRLIIQRIFG
jgi:putative chitinase